MNSKIAVLACVFLVAFIAGYLLPSKNLPEKTSGKITSLALLAVNSQGIGEFARIEIALRQGMGKTEINESYGLPLISPDTKKSLLEAANYSRSYANFSYKSTDISIAIIGNSSVIAGGSAGAACAVAIISALEGTMLKENILLTGSILENGRIGRVGLVLQKARAMVETKYDTLLVPIGEKKEWIIPAGCANSKNLEMECKPARMEIDVEEETGIRIIEVKTVGEAYGLMRK